MSSDQPEQPPIPGLEYFATVTAFVSSPVELGRTREGSRRIIPIDGGTLRGPAGDGEILPGGADFQLIRSETTTELLAKYAIRMGDGGCVNVDNFGIRTASADDISALIAGRPVPPERVYFRCVPRLSGTGRWAWVDDRVFLGSGRRYPDRVEVDIFEVR